MPISRWIWILLAALAGLAVFLFATRAPTQAPAAATAAPERTAAVPLPLPASTPGDAVATAAPPPVPATGTAAMPAAPALPKRPPVGSEGYGPHIERAHAGNDAPAAWESVQWLRQCATNEGRRHSFETLRNQGVSPEMMTQLMVEADAEARRCQTITAQHRALLPELAARAMRAGVPEAASAYAAAAFPADLTPAQRKEVADAMRRDAFAGHAMSLLGALVSNEAWGLSEAERLAFLAAYVQLQPTSDLMAKQLLEQAIQSKAAPTPAQLAAAKQLAQQIVERARAGKPS